MTCARSKLRFLNFPIPVAAEVSLDPRHRDPGNPMGDKFLQRQSAICIYILMWLNWQEEIRRARNMW